MIKAFLFDYGGVMTTGGRGAELVERLSNNIGVSTDRAFELLGLGWDDYASGRIEEEELWRRLEEKHGKPITTEQRCVWNDRAFMQPLPEMVALVAELKKQGFPVGLLSNVVPSTAKEVRAIGGYDGFDFTILSFETGFGKPQPEIYQLALDELPGIKPEEVVFLDDKQSFLDPAIAMGIQPILVTSSEQAIADVHALLEKQS